MNNYFRAGFVMGLVNLGLIPGLAAKTLTLKSGPKPGNPVFAFEPWHVSGPDKGTKTCPICKYGKIAAVQVWMNHDSSANILGLAQVLESEITKHGATKLKAFVVDYNATHKATAVVSRNLKELAAQATGPNVAFTYLSNFNDPAVEAYEINTKAAIKNTVIVYVNRKAVATFVNLQADNTGKSRLVTAINKAVAGFRRVE